MTIQRVPEIPYAQIANNALRDRRLSFKARGILAMVLSHAGEWEATARWIEDQSAHDGPHAIQTALNELTALGYRSVSQERDSQGRLRTVASWKHTPDTPIIRPPGNPPTGLSDRRKTDPAIEDYPSEDHKKNTQTIVQKPVSNDRDFESFWDVYPRKEGKGHARRAWEKAQTKAPAAKIILGAKRYLDDPNREKQFTRLAATWLNGECWDDEPLPKKPGLASGGAVTVMDQYTEPCPHGDPRGVQRCALCRKVNL